MTQPLLLSGSNGPGTYSSGDVVKPDGLDDWSSLDNLSNAEDRLTFDGAWTMPGAGIINLTERRPRLIHYVVFCLP